jgi:hypothetical protein
MLVEKHYQIKSRGLHWQPIKKDLQPSSRN